MSHYSSPARYGCHHLTPDDVQCDVYSPPLFDISNRSLFPRPSRHFIAFIQAAFLPYLLFQHWKGSDVRFESKESNILTIKPKTMI